MSGELEGLRREVADLREANQQCTERLLAAIAERKRWCFRAQDLLAALRDSADDLYKASNQFAGLMPHGNNAGVFERKADAARRVEDDAAGWFS